MFLNIMFYLLVTIQTFYLFVTAWNSDSINFPKDESYGCNQGTCVNIRDCPVALNEVKKGINPTTCYFIHFDQYVCCSTPSSTNFPQYNPQLTSNRLTQSKSDKKCQEQIDMFSKDTVEEDLFFHIAVVGGEDAKSKEFPYMTAIGWKRDNGNIDYLCGGVLITNDFILTAAHCTSEEGISPQHVRIGGESLSSDITPVDILKIFVHPLYKVLQKYNDIAVIQIQTYSGKDVPCLWTNYNLNNQNEVTAIGYGLTEFAGDSSDILQKVNLTVISNQQCSTHYPPGPAIPNGIVDSQLCAGDPKGEKDTCQGDSGGPVLFKVPVGNNTISYIVGITSFGQVCATTTPSVYTRISSYIGWIESIVWP